MGKKKKPKIKEKGRKPQEREEDEKKL